MTDMKTAVTHTEQDGNGIASSAIAEDAYLFGPVVVKIQQAERVWKLTPHGQTLGEGMAKARHALVGKTAIEIGVGTGVHAIAALKLGVREIDVTDIEAAALESAALNATRNGVAYRKSWVQDWMRFEPEEPYNLVLCNPPFCKAGKPDRRFFIQSLIQEAPRFLRRGGHLLFVQSSMANFALTEQELSDAGFYFTPVHETRKRFRDYYFQEPGFLEESRRVKDGFEEIEGTYVETLRVYLCTKP
ncbi:methyltransferase [Thalassoroseus pseudoceratinae]|uniref:methyltransferase n=1 Tax=Thalassoroseus pseudoceratinae TaxID=2713176 RepID=UPI0014216A2F|nr:methyltransferase [Thalassoroseus pseudoceratinae]